MSRHHFQIHRRHWQVVRRAVFHRDGHRCVQCGRAGRLECDHVTPLEREPGQDLYDPAGCQTLYRPCHIVKTAAETAATEAVAGALSRAFTAATVDGPRILPRPSPRASWDRSAAI